MSGALAAGLHDLEVVLVENLKPSGEELEHADAERLAAAAEAQP